MRMLGEGDHGCRLNYVVLDHVGMTITFSDITFKCDRF